MFRKIALVLAVFAAISLGAAVPADASTKIPTTITASAPASASPYSYVTVTWHVSPDPSSQPPSNRGLVAVVVSGSNAIGCWADVAAGGCAIRVGTAPTRYQAVYNGSSANNGLPTYQGSYTAWQGPITLD